MNKVKYIIIWGMGITGQACAKYLEDQGRDFIIIDKKNPAAFCPVEQWKRLKAAYAENEFDEEKLSQINVDFILASPGIDMRKGLWPQIKQLGHKIIGDIEYVYQESKRPIIAVTGTNGKSTTVNMIKMGLELAGKKVFLGGNWGIPAIECLNKDKHLQYDWIILETSSFQLELTKKFAPQISVITNIFMSHSERYDNFQNYLNAKLQIINASPLEQNHVIVPKAQKEIFFEQLESVSKIAHYYDPKDLSLFDFSKAKVIGKHNLDNFAATYQVLKAASVENLEAVMQKLIDQFEGIPHRLEKVLRWNEVYFYNDSKSTNMESTKTALNSFNQFLPHHPIILILGGKLRSENAEFLLELKKYDKVTWILSIGEAQSVIKNTLSNIKRVETLNDLEGVKNFLKKHLIADPLQKIIVLFSPSFPSFDQFKNFEDRGQKFKEMAKELIKDLPAGH